MDAPRYTVVENKHTGQDAIMLLDEPFAGIVYYYDNIQISEDEEASSISIKFDYDILNKANKEFGNAEPFEKYIGIVLQYILHETITKGQI